jgi:ribosome-interacting GTPase 1
MKATTEQINRQQRTMWQQKTIKLDLTPNYSNVPLSNERKRTWIKQSRHNGWEVIEENTVTHVNEQHISTLIKKYTVMIPYFN